MAAVHGFDQHADDGLLARDQGLGGDEQRGATGHAGAGGLVGADVDHAGQAPLRRDLQVVVGVGQQLQALGLDSRAGADLRNGLAGQLDLVVCDHDLVRDRCAGLQRRFEHDLPTRQHRALHIDEGLEV